MTTQIGPGGWARLTRDQQVDALAWYRVTHEPPEERKAREDAEKQAAKDRFKRRIAEARSSRG